MEMILRSASRVNTGSWQSTDISNDPSMDTYELLNHSFQVAVSSEDLTPFREDIKPNLPWADDHFEERINGWPLNPGKQWANWPWANKADTFRNKDGQFSHTYMERYFPKFAGIYLDDTYPVEGRPHGGIRFSYGDLADVVQLLVKYPDTRQAYLPVWFPEDTGCVHGQRIPCSLGYHFIQRHDHLHCVYYLRSCDIYRHFRDDVYLTVRLMLWVLDACRALSSTWDSVKPGIFTMHITSLHMFVNDRVLIQRAVDIGNQDS